MARNAASVVLKMCGGVSTLGLVVRNWDEMPMVRYLKTHV